jgi:hypothetical protein
VRHAPSVGTATGTRPCSPPACGSFAGPCPTTSWHPSWLSNACQPYLEPSVQLIGRNGGWTDEGMVRGRLRRARHGPGCGSNDQRHGWAKRAGAHAGRACRCSAGGAPPSCWWRWGRRCYARRLHRCAAPRRCDGRAVFPC